MRTTDRMLRHVGRELNVLSWIRAGFRSPRDDAEAKEGRYEHQLFARPRGPQLDSYPVACVSAGLQLGRAEQFQAACFVRIVGKIRPYRSMDRNFDNRLHAFENEWAVAVRCESRHDVDVYRGRSLGDDRHLRIRPWTKR
jgi:hypothetical protein